jgi:hypothetical protein
MSYSAAFSSHTPAHPISNLPGLIPCPSLAHILDPDSSFRISLSYDSAIPGSSLDLG